MQQFSAQHYDHCCVVLAVADSKNLLKNTYISAPFIVAVENSKQRTLVDCERMDDGTCMGALLHMQCK